MRRFCALLICLVLVPAPALAAPDPLLGYARDTWRSLAAMTDPRTGLVADSIDSALTTRADYTSPTNIGGYLWSAVVASRLGIISRAEARSRVVRTLDTLATMPRHAVSGMFYNWYDPATGAVSARDFPFLSSVDNGWLAAALHVVKGTMPGLPVDRVLAPMDFGFFHDPERGLIRGGFWEAPPPVDCSVPQDGVWFTCNHYDITVTEPRIATYLGIAAGQIPPDAYFATMRTLPDTCDYAWQEMRPTGFTVTHLGRSVFEGSYRYRGITFVPSWGGDMFEALMPDLFVPEAAWGPRSWGRNHPATVAAQIEHGLHDAGYGYWGFSPAADPAGGYAVWGVDAMGMDTNGYPSDAQATRYDAGFEGCREPGPAPDYGDGVVTPHAAFLALPYARGPVLANLAALRRDFAVYGPGGFADAVNVGTGQVARRHLSLDQSMIMGALGNELAGDVLKRAFVTPAFERRIRPLLAREEFNVPVQRLPQLGRP
ncbi:glucoamylase family protein [Actinoplanes sp. RD1]|uniref:glucoamylase family protein n=1 Tax=Actinoplanes sp. RD1 TaxID=3064538 RepID=UPI002741CC4A|nr:glucoamylase family protein [Actinoplanes sp. RD1]